ncbi:hypothetical protein [Tumebacillus sp. BK434]|uniref:hypothetical protein n=1 Tax=Tumebacillus sp. BK434 TaxID=2512169 RepID=UPI0010472212|nr:hypothetical protein [Tumebacillus sp. BK434]
MWVVNEGSTVTDANLRIVVFLNNNSSILEVNGSGAVTRSVSLVGKFSGSITAVKMPTTSSTLEVDWVYFTTYDSVATARFYAVDMTNGNVYNLYTNTTMPTAGWNYIGVIGDGTAYNKVLLACTNVTLEKTSVYPIVAMNIAKGALGGTTAPALSNLQTCTVQRLMAAAPTTHGTVATLYACEAGVLGVTAAWSGTQYYGSRYHWAIGNNSTTQPYGGTFGSSLTSTPSHVFSNYSEYGMYVFERSDKATGSLFSVGQSTSGALGESDKYYIDRLGTEAYTGRPKLGSRDLYQGLMGDVFQISTSQSYATNYTNGLVVQSDIKPLQFWSHVGLLTTVPEPLLNGVSSHRNLCTIAVKGTQLYKYDGTYGRIIQ